MTNRIFHVTQNEVTGRHVINGFVVVARTANEARKVHPAHRKAVPAAEWRDEMFPSWATSWRNTSAREIGVAAEGVEAGFVMDGGTLEG